MKGTHSGTFLILYSTQVMYEMWLSILAASSSQAVHTNLDTINVILFAIGALIGVLGFISAVWGARAYLSTAKVKAQLEAKDETINTNEQLIKALERRVTTLESERGVDKDRMRELESNLNKLQTELVDSRARYDELKNLADKYSAPVAVERFEDLLNRHHEETVKLIAGLR